MHDALRCLFSSRSEIVVAALEFLEKLVSSPLENLFVEYYYPQETCCVSSSKTEQSGDVATFPSSRNIFHMFFFLYVMTSLNVFFSIFFHAER